MLRLAIIGAGIMGSNHARVSRSLRDAQVTFVVDPDAERAREIAAHTEAATSGKLLDVLGKVDAAIVAVPTALHAPVAIELVRRGIHVLVEKPIALDVRQAALLVEEARAAGVVLQVGHVERFNPAVLEVDRLVDGLVHIDFARISPYSDRVRDGAIIDLMIHDLDLAAAMTKCDVTSVCATARDTKNSGFEDLASALLVFESGVTASLVASRLGQNKIRRICLTQRSNFVSVDLLRQAVTINRVNRVEYLSDQGMSYRQTGVIEVPFLEHHGEPLHIELSEFVTAIQQGAPPRVSGEDGLRALQLAIRVSQAAVRT